MKRSRIICSIITVITILLSVALGVILIKSSIEYKSGLNIIYKLAYGLLFVLFIGLYIFSKKRLLNKVKSKKLINGYCYMYLIVIAFVSRIIAYYLTKDSIINYEHSFSDGFLSYLNYGVMKIFNSNLYANVIINTVLATVSCILIKRIILNISSNDIIATLSAVTYLFLPNSLLNVVNYSRYGYNVLFILIGIYIFLKIIDDLKDFNKKSNRYYMVVV